MNFSPFAGHFPAIHQFAASGALASSVSATTNGASSSTSHLDSRYSHPHHHSGGGGTSSAQPHHSGHFNQSQLLGKLRGTSAAEEMNKYGHSTSNGGGVGNQQLIHHYGAQQYTSSQEVSENGNKHLRVGNSSHSLGLNAMTNGTAYHHGNADQGQDLGHVRKRLL